MEVDLAPHTVVGSVLQVGDAGVSSCTWFRKPGSISSSLFFFSESASRVHVSQQ